LIYGVILSEIYEKEIQTVELLYLKDGIKLTLDPTAEQIQKVKDLLTDTRKQIDIRCESEVFEPTVSALCGWCHFKPICPEWSKK
jgi:putative RecB family exonuclease